MLERGPVVVDVRQADGHGGGGGVSAAEAQHILRLHHHHVLVPGFAVHVGPRRDDDACGTKREGRWDRDKEPRWAMVCLLAV